jgi:hypothetical protein
MSIGSIGGGGGAGAGGPAAIAGGSMPFGPAGMSGAQGVHRAQHPGAALLIAAYQQQHKHHHGHQDGELLCILGLALLQMGIGAQGHGGPHGHGGRGPMVGAAGGSDGNMGQQGRDSMHQMLHSVVQASKKHGGLDASFDTGLQGLIAGLSAGQSSGHQPHPAFKQLQHDFTQMVSAVHGPAATGTHLNVVHFLQSMQSNLAGAALPSSGGLVNTSA